WLQNAAAWAAALLLVAGGLFVAVEMMAKGGGPFADLLALFGRLPPVLGYAASFAALLWPLLLPAGLVWLAVYWSILLWAHATWSERAVIASLWLLLGVLPLLASLEQRQASAVMSRPARALAALESHRLYGRLFADLDSLRAGLPESPAVSHLLADFHLSLGQWEQARPLYRQVVTAEPKNTAALLALGGYSFSKEDLPAALQYFEQAAVADPGDPAPLFNQVQVYLRTYKFEAAVPIRARARQLDRARYSRWEQAKERIVLPRGGMARIPEIRRQLWTAGLEKKGAGRDWVREGASFAVSALALVLALAVRWLRRSLPAYPPATWWLRWRSLDLLRRALLPGMAAAETGRGFELFFTLLVPAGLLLLPFSDRFGVRIPWGYDPGNAIAWTLG
ncbi:MAG TPA: tetratricopeptide repeat protein, partial [Methylomirabilota bacterium]|nr:tetratricopeptide repeat protein [Methylomirabilota bacterium]